jgi:hypothetical protein
MFVCRPPAAAFSAGGDQAGKDDNLVIQGRDGRMGRRALQSPIGLHLVCASNVFDFLRIWLAVR